MEKKNLIWIISLYLTLVLLIVPTRAYSTKLYPIDDAYVDSYYPNDNYGASDYLFIGTYLFGGYCVTFIKFQIPSSDRTVLSAIVSTYWYNFMCETWLTIKAGTTDNTWNEQTITFNNCPYFYNDLLATASITDGDHLEFDVLNLMPESGAFSIIIWEESPYSGEYLQGDSKECELVPDPPYLTITYESRIEDFLPAIIWGTVGGIVGVASLLGVGFYLRNKKRREKIGLERLEREKVEKIHKIEHNFCPNCGKSIIKGALFCSNCGTQL